MRSPELAKRYAKPLFELASTPAQQEKILGELRALGAALGRDQDIFGFFSSPMVTPDDRVAILKKAVENSGASEEVLNLLYLLANNGRLSLLNDVVESYQTLVDEKNGLIRGVVRSASELGPAERQKIEQTVERVLSKRVILTYKIDPTVIGGLVAQAGSFTFDDSLDSHLTRLNDELKRRAL